MNDQERIRKAVLELLDLLDPQDEKYQLFVTFLAAHMWMEADDETRYDIVASHLASALPEYLS